MESKEEILGLLCLVTGTSWPRHSCCLQINVPKAVIFLARLWLGMESAKSLFLAKAKTSIFSADIFFFFSIFFFFVSQPIIFFSFESYMENLTYACKPYACYGVHSMKSSQVQLATKKPKRIAALTPEQNEGPEGGVEASRRKVHT